MKVHVAFAGEYEWRYIVGVFASEDSAKAALRQNPDWQKSDKERLFAFKRGERTVSGKPMHWLAEPSFDIEEHEVIE